MKVVAIHQPSYLPWFGILDKIARCDLFVVLDTVQYNKRAYQHRTLISRAAGKQYLSLAVNAKGHQKGLQIRDVALADSGLPAKHLETLRHRYHKSPGWELVQCALAPVLLEPPPDLLGLSVATMQVTLDLFGLRPQLVLASELSANGAKSELMLNLTRAAGGNVYLSGSGALTYMEDALFDAADIVVEYQEFVHPEFPQSHGVEFQEGCLALEWLIEDPQGARAKFHEHLLRTGAQPPRCLVQEKGLV